MFNYLKKLTDEQIIKFISCYVKNSHIKLHDCYDDCKIDVKLDRKNDKVYAKTIISDCTGCIEESWILSDYKVVSEEYNNSEIVDMTKTFAKYVYTTFNKTDKELATNYKKDYVEFWQANMQAEINGAKYKFQEKLF